jgi:ATP-dependent RNA helicase DDX55/SPB4
MGSDGQALLFLTPSEASYVDFLRINKGLKLQPYPISPAPCVRDRARSLIGKDKELYQLGMRAFVSFVRFYYKHECKLIFQARSLDLLAHARGFALLHLPKMPELKRVDTCTFDSYPVPATFRAKGRVHSLQEGTADCMQRTAHRPRRIMSAKGQKQMSGAQGQKRRQALSDSDLEELARDARLLKKFKSGKISEAELDRQLQIA